MLGALGGGVAAWAWSALGVSAAVGAAALSVLATVASLASGAAPAGPLATLLAWWWAGSALSVPVALLGMLAAPGLPTTVGTMGAAHALGLGLSAWGMFVERWWVRAPRLELYIAGLPPELDGYRILHLSDLHIARFTPARRVAEWERRIRQLVPDLIIITGDLSSRSGYRTREVAATISRLSAPDGVVLSFGNHERLEAEQVAQAIAEVAPGARLLRGTWLEIRRGDSSLHLLGIDDWERKPGRIASIAAARPAGAIVVLLAHSRELTREVLAAAPALAPSLVLMGHTHGGQIGVPGLGRWLNLTLLTGQWTRRLARVGERWEFVNAGLGTSGPPLRLGVRPELPTLVLRSAPATMRSS